MNAAHWMEAIVLALAGIGCVAAGRWRLAFAPLTCVEAFERIALHTRRLPEDERFMPFMDQL